MPKPLTFPQKLERFPPIIVRLLARTRDKEGGVRALTDAEVAAASDLPISTVVAIAKLTSAGSLDIDTQQAFYRGCGADLDNRDWLRKNAAYMASIRGAPRYLRKSPDWETTFEPLIRILLREGSRD
jgi:hypothetical protein